MVLGISKVFWAVTEPHHLVDIINQTSVDAQYTIDSCLFKLEAITRFGQGDLFFIFDIDQEERIFSLEFKRRLTDQLNLEIEGQVYNNVDSGDILGGFANDSHIELRLPYFF